MKWSSIILILSFLSGFLFSLMVTGQIQYGGAPLSMQHLPLIPEPVPHILAEPPFEMRGEESLPLQIGVTVPVSLNPAVSGIWTNSPEGDLIWRITIKIPGAKGLGLYYSAFRIPEGGRLFVYTPGYAQMIGSFNQENNPDGGLFATEILPGDEVILEYNGAGTTRTMLSLEISEILYIYRDLNFLEPERGFGDSGPCEVNVNCPEGNSWKDEKRGVAKIVLKEGGSAYLCTGSLVNNVRNDSTPYFLTANHCGPNASSGDYAQWIFYFNYEAPGCTNPLINPPSQTITGSSMKAKGFNDPSIGSDFKLLLLDEYIPENYNPYFNGWERGNAASSDGAGIHHPKGDIKKISTYTASLVSCDYNSGGTDPNGMFWRVVWSETVSGHGVTEGGSSGSPIFNAQHQIVGTLTGGAASCQNLSAPDYYGKFSWHWESNGSNAGSQLKPWLDPDNTGVNELEGFGYGNILSAGFSADHVSIAVGDYVTFLDQTSGTPTQWEWYFEQGNPGNSSWSDSVTVAYGNVGKYDVRLAVSDGQTADTLLKKDYIEVRALFYPNPAGEFLYMDFGRDPVTIVLLEIFDMNGRLVNELREEQSSHLYRIELPELREGMYFFKYTVDGRSYDPEKIIILN